MPNYLLWGANPSTRETKAQEILEEHYLHSIESEGKIIAVKQVRARMPHWHVHPQMPWKRSGLLVLEAQRMNEEVQNTLLKVLEEPPTFFTFVFTAPHPGLLLPTVVSRCLITRVPGDYQTENGKIAAEILAASAGQRLAIFEEKIGYEREAATAFINDLEVQLAAEPNPIIKNIWETKKLLQDDSTNLKMAVDCLLLSW
jgi:DNA polymerase-3 subunit delta'